MADDQKSDAMPPELRAFISHMVEQGADDETIRGFLQKYAEKMAPVSAVSADEPGTFWGGFFKSLTSGPGRKALTSNIPTRVGQTLAAIPGGALDAVGGLKDDVIGLVQAGIMTAEQAAHLASDPKAASAFFTQAKDFLTKGDPVDDARTALLNRATAAYMKDPAAFQAEMGHAIGMGGAGVAGGMAVNKALPAIGRLGTMLSTAGEAAPDAQAALNTIARGGRPVQGATRLVARPAFRIAGKALETVGGVAPEEAAAADAATISQPASSVRVPNKFSTLDLSQPPPEGTGYAGRAEAKAAGRARNKAILDARQATGAATAPADAAAAAPSTATPDLMDQFQATQAGPKPAFDWPEAGGRFEADATGSHVLQQPPSAQDVASQLTAGTEGSINPIGVKRANMGKPGALSPDEWDFMNTFMGNGSTDEAEHAAIRSQMGQAPAQTAEQGVAATKPKADQTLEDYLMGLPADVMGAENPSMTVEGRAAYHPEDEALIRSTSDEPPLPKGRESKPFSEMPETKGKRRDEFAPHLSPNDVDMLTGNPGMSLEDFLTERAFRNKGYRTGSLSPSDFQG